VTKNLLISRLIKTNEMHFVVVLWVVMMPCGWLSLDQPLGWCRDGHPQGIESLG
jgi:hypothetical protein